MGILTAVALIVCGALAAATLIVQKQPNAKEALEKLRPYQGWIGVVVAICGTWSLIWALIYLPSWFGVGFRGVIWWLTYFLSAALEFGLGFLLGGLRHHTLIFNPNAVSVYNSLMFIAVISLAFPSIYEQIFASTGPTIEQEKINLGFAVLLLSLYVLYLVFMIRTHPEVFEAVGGGGHADEGEKPWSMTACLTVLVVSSVMAAFLSEIDHADLGALPDRAIYNDVAALGLSIFDLPGKRAEQLRADWGPLLGYVGGVG